MIHKALTRRFYSLLCEKALFIGVYIPDDVITDLFNHAL